MTDQKLPRVFPCTLKFVLGQNAPLVHFYPVGIVPLHAVVLKLYRTPLQTLKSFCLWGGCVYQKPEIKNTHLFKNSRNPLHVAISNSFGVPGWLSMLNVPILDFGSGLWAHIGLPGERGACLQLSLLLLLPKKGKRSIVLQYCWSLARGQLDLVYPQLHSILYNVFWAELFGKKKKKKPDITRISSRTWVAPKS